MRRLVPFAAAGVLLAIALAVPALGLTAGSQGTVYACVSNNHTLTHVSLSSPMACPSQQPVSWPVTAGGTPSPSPSPSPSPTAPSPSPPPTAPPTAPPAGTCVAQLGGGCPGGHGYQWAGWAGSTGYNTYVLDQSVGAQPGSTGGITVTDPSHWTATGNYVPCGGCVQTFTAVQQLMENWSADGTWSGTSDTPLSGLASLTVTYDESSPSGAGDQYEFAPDIWTNYAGHLCGSCGDIMMWADTSAQRCPAVNGWPVLGHPVIGGQNWTVHVGPSVAGDEIILVLDGAGGPGTCARQSSGTLDVYAALQWLSANPGGTGFPAFSSLTMSQLNTGWEITDAAGGTYQVNSLAYSAAVR